MDLYSKLVARKHLQNTIVSLEMEMPFNGITPFPFHCLHISSLPKAFSTYVTLPHLSWERLWSDTASCLHLNLFCYLKKTLLLSMSFEATLKILLRDEMTTIQEANRK